MKNANTTIYLVRHGEAMGNLKHDNAVSETLKTYGILGGPLTELGKNQAQEIAEHLKNVHFDAAYSSDLTRAVQTAEIITKERNLQLITLSTIRERNYGDQFWELTLEQRNMMENGLKDLSDKENLNYRFFPDSETEFEAVNRLREFIKQIVPLYYGKTVLVVSHGNLMRSFLKQIGWARYAELPPGAVKNTGYFVLQTDGSDYKILKTYGVNKFNIIKSTVNAK